MSTGTCSLCSESHPLYNCAKFLAMNTEERPNEVKRLKLCINCLRNDHFVRSYKHGSYRECTGRHNTLLHHTKIQATTSTATETPTIEKSTRTACHSSSTSRRNVLMATAIVDAANQEGFSLPIRVLLDSGSEANFITQNVCNKLVSTNAVLLICSLEQNSSSRY